MARDLFYHVRVIAGAAIYDLSRDLTSFSIEEDETMADVLKLHLSDPFKVFSHAFQEGMDVEVDLGSVDDHSLIFRGRIYQVEADFPLDAVPRLVIHAHDHSMKMGLLKRKRVFRNKTLKQIVVAIAGNPDYGFRHVDVQVYGDPLFKGNGLRQHNQTDRGFLLDLASEFGAILYVDADQSGDNFHFLSQYHVMKESDPVASLYYGRSEAPARLVSFEARSDVDSIRLPRVLSGIDYKTGKRLQPRPAPIKALEQPQDRFLDENLTAFRQRDPGKAARLETLITAAEDVKQQVWEERGRVEHVAIPTFTTSQELSERAENQYSTSLLGMEANGATAGYHRLHAQATVEIVDAGRFSGRWFLSQVRHIVDGQGYHTRFKCRR